MKARTFFFTSKGNGARTGGARAPAIMLNRTTPVLYSIHCSSVVIIFI